MTAAEDQRAEEYDRRFDWDWLGEHARQMVETAPALTPERRTRLADLLGGQR